MNHLSTLVPPSSGAALKVLGRLLVPALALPLFLRTGGGYGRARGR